MNTELDQTPAPIRNLELNGRTIQISSFRDLDNALDVALNHRTRPSMVVLGDAPWYWVVSVADAQRLERAGYELISPSAEYR